MTYLNPELAGCFDERALVDAISSLDGEVFREAPGRRTVRFEWQGRGYFAKSHSGVGWLEILKNLFQLRLPVIGAANEWQAINRLPEIGVDTMTAVAYVSEGLNPATRRSCIVTRELEDTISLEDFFADTVPPPAMKRALIVKIASIARRLHENGVNHRDFYICHFLMPRESSSLQLFLIDLHRAQIRYTTPRRWRVKDIGGLLFSAFDVSMTRRDLYRFMIHYTGKSLREVLQSDRRFWSRVVGRARALYLQDHDSLPDWFTQLERSVGH